MVEERSILRPLRVFRCLKLPGRRWAAIVIPVIPDVAPNQFTSRKLFFQPEISSERILEGGYFFWGEIQILEQRMVCIDGFWGPKRLRILGKPPK